MKKKILVTALAAGLVLPTGAVLANENPFATSNQGANALATEIGRAYALAYANAATAKQAHETTSRILLHEEQQRDVVYAAEDAKVAAAKKAVEAKVAEWNRAKEVAVAFNHATETERNAAINEVNSTFGKPYADLVDALEKTEEAAAKAKAKADKAVSEAKAQNDKAFADLVAAQAEKERLYKEFIARGGTYEDAKKLEEKASEEMKPEVKPEVTPAPKAETKKGEKVLPKTSAVK